MDESFVIVDDSLAKEFPVLGAAGCQTEHADGLAVLQETVDTMSQDESAAAETAVQEPVDKSLCLFHGPQWRAKFQQVVNLVRETIIPVKYIRKLGYVVCTCDAQRNAVTDKDVDIRPEVLLEHFNYLKVTVAEVKPALRDLPGGLKTLLPTPAHKGMHRLLFILYKAIEKGDFSLLETKPNPWAQPKDEMNGSRKKFTLDLPQSYLGLLFGAQGKHIKAACKTYNAKVNVEERKKFDGSRSRSRSYQPMKTGFQVTLSTGPDGKLDLLEDHLVKKAAKIIRQREAHTRRLTKYSAERYARQQAWNAHRDKTRSRGTDSWGMKEKATEDFLKRSKHNGKGNHGPKKVKSAKVLEEGSRCLNCLAPHPKLAGSSRSASESDSESEESEGGATVPATGEAECRYHKGYIAEKREWHYSLEWTCCEQAVSSRVQSVQQESHKNTGCCVESRHNWRPTKKQSKRGPPKDRNTGIDAVNSSLKQMNVDGNEAISMATQLQYL